MNSIFRKVMLASAMVFGSLHAATFFPLQTGNTWTYRNNATGAAFTVRVGTPLISNGNVYYSLRGYVAENVLVRIDEHNTLVYLDRDTEQDRPLVSFAAFEGGWLYAPYRPCDQESQTQQRRGTYNGPTGEFNEVVEIRFRSFGCADAGTEVEQFTENVGMLRRVDTSIGGRQQFDLVYARVGSAIYNALPNGSFSVTLDQVPGNDALTAVLRFRSNAAPVRLNFASAQEYDVVLKDESSRVVWRWSDGQVFDQAAHTKDVSVEWSIAVPVPKPEHGNYTLQGWLTTEGPVPTYAAAATVPIS